MLVSLVNKNALFVYISGGRGGGGYDRQDGDFSSFSGGGRRNESRPGDWMCVGCQANNFASRVSCFKCNEPRT